MKYITFKEFYWKKVLWSLGIPWGLLTGLIVVITENEDVLKYFTSKSTIITLLGFIAGGFLFAFLYGKSIWKRIRATEEEIQKEQQNASLE